MIMAIIFAFSSQPGDSLPNFLSWDYFVKKTSHAIGYGLLALSYLHLLKNFNNRLCLAWLLAVAFSATDEFHQSFVSGRHASIWDVIIFDNFGALLMLFMHNRYWSDGDEKNTQM